MDLLARINRWKVSLDSSELKRVITVKVCSHLLAEKAHLYVVDESSQELALLGVEDGAVSRIPIGSGILGRVVANGQVVNFDDQSTHEWYDQQYDAVPRELGKTKPCMICAPLREPHSGRIIAVLRVIGKRKATQSPSADAGSADDAAEAAFTPEDEALLQLIGFQIAAVLCCNAIYTRTTTSTTQTRLAGQGDIHTVADVSDPAAAGASPQLASVRPLIGLTSQEAALEEGERAARSLVAAQHCRIYLFDDRCGDSRGVLRSWVNGEYCEVEAAAATTAGWCAFRAEPLSVADIYSDRRFNANLTPRGREAGGQGGDDACAVLCVPIPGGAGADLVADEAGGVRRPLGVVECIRAGQPFGGGEEAALTALALVLADALRAARRAWGRDRLARSAAELVSVREEGLSAAAAAAARDVLGCRRALLLLFTAEGQALQTAELSEFGLEVDGSPHAAKLAQGAPGTAAWQMRSGVAAYVATTRKVFRSRGGRDARLHAHEEEESAAAAMSGTNGYISGAGEAMLCAPVAASDGRLVGLLYALGKLDGGSFTDEDVEAASGLAQQLAAVAAVCDERRRRTVERDLYQRFAASLPELCWEADPHRLLRLMATAVCDALGAGHCTAYLLDPGTGQLRTRAEGVNRDICVPAGRGAAGRAAATGQMVRIDDIHSVGLSERSELGGGTAGGGAEARCILCCPMIGSKGASVGVLQAFHAAPGAFSSTHEELLGLYARVAAAAVENCRILAQRCGGNLWSLPADGDETRLREAMRAGAQDLMQSEAAALYVLNSAGNCLLSLPRPGRDSTVECRSGQGIVGSVFISGNGVLTEHAALLPGYDAAVDKLTRLEARSMLCVPVCDAAGCRIGVMLAVNKRRGVFNREDEVLLKQLCTQCGEVLRVCRRHHRLVLEAEESSRF